MVYYKREPRKHKSERALGEVMLLGCTIERIGGGDGTFQVHTKERTLTLRALGTHSLSVEADMRRWVLAVEASGGIAEFDVEAKKRPSLRPQSSGGTLSEHSGGSETGLGDKPKVRPSVTWSSVDKSKAMPPMEGYLHKQVGRPAGGGSLKLDEAKWEERYFVIPPGMASLRYYKSQRDHREHKEPAGSINISNSGLVVERLPTLHVVHIQAEKRGVAIRAESESLLQQWVEKLSCQGRARSVQYLDGDTRPGAPSGASPVIAPTAGRSRQGTASGGIKLLLLGDMNVGKTSVLTRFSDGMFFSSTRPTIGTDLKKTRVDLDGDGRNPISLQIWDTAGQEAFRSIIANYYRGAHGVMIMFDVTRRSTFESLHGWLEEIQRKAPEGIAKLLVGNKCDLEGARRDQIEMGGKLQQQGVDFEEAQQWADEHGLRYIETSAIDGPDHNHCPDGVKAAFVALVASALGREEELEKLLQTAKVEPGGHADTFARQSNINGLSKSQPKGGGCAC